MKKISHLNVDVKAKSEQKIWMKEGFRPEFQITISKWKLAWRSKSFNQRFQEEVSHTLETVYNVKSWFLHVNRSGRLACTCFSKPSSNSAPESVLTSISWSTVTLCDRVRLPSLRLASSRLVSSGLVSSRLASSRLVSSRLASSRTADSSLLPLGE